MTLSASIREGSSSTIVAWNYSNDHDENSIDSDITSQLLPMVESHAEQALDLMHRFLQVLRAIPEFQVLLPKGNITQRHPQQQQQKQQQERESKDRDQATTTSATAAHLLDLVSVVPEYDATLLNDIQRLHERCESISNRIREWLHSKQQQQERKPPEGEWMLGRLDQATAQNGDDEFCQHPVVNVVQCVILPLIRVLYGSYLILDDVVEEGAERVSATTNKRTTNKATTTATKPKPPRGMLSLQNYTDVATFLEWIVYTVLAPCCCESTSIRDDVTVDCRLLHDGVQQQQQKQKQRVSASQLGRRLPRAAFAWGSNHINMPNNNNNKTMAGCRRFLLRAVVPAVTDMLFLDRFRPMLLPRHLADLDTSVFQWNHDYHCHCYAETTQQQQKQQRISPVLLRGDDLEYYVLERVMTKLLPQLPPLSDNGCNQQATTHRDSTSIDHCSGNQQPLGSLVLPAATCRLSFAELPLLQARALQRLLRAGLHTPIWFRQQAGQALHVLAQTHLLALIHVFVLTGTTMTAVPTSAIVRLATTLTMPMAAGHQQQQQQQQHPGDHRFSGAKQSESLSNDGYSNDYLGRLMGQLRIVLDQVVRMTKSTRKTMTNQQPQKGAVVGGRDTTTAAATLAWRQLPLVAACHVQTVWAVLALLLQQQRRRQGGRQHAVDWWSNFVIPQLFNDDDDGDKDPTTMISMKSKESGCSDETALTAMPVSWLDRLAVLLAGWDLPAVRHHEVLWRLVLTQFPYSASSSSSGGHHISRRTHLLGRLLDESAATTVACSSDHSSGCAMTVIEDKVSDFDDDSTPSHRAALLIECLERLVEIGCESPLASTLPCCSPSEQSTGQRVANKCAHTPLHATQTSLSSASASPSRGVADPYRFLAVVLVHAIVTFRLDDHGADAAFSGYDDDCVTALFSGQDHGIAQGWVHIMEQRARVLFDQVLKLGHDPTSRRIEHGGIGHRTSPLVSRLFQFLLWLYLRQPSLVGDTGAFDVCSPSSDKTGWSRRQCLVDESYDYRDQRHHAMRWSLLPMVMLPMLCESCSFEPLLFGIQDDSPDAPHDKNGILDLIRVGLFSICQRFGWCRESLKEGQSSSFAFDTNWRATIQAVCMYFRDSAGVVLPPITRDIGDSRGNSSQEDDADLLLSIASVLLNLLVAILELGSAQRPQHEEDALQSLALPLEAFAREQDSQSNVVRDEASRAQVAHMAEIASHAFVMLAARRRSSSELSGSPVTTGHISERALSQEEIIEQTLHQAELALTSSEPAVRARGMVALRHMAHSFEDDLRQAKQQLNRPVLLGSPTTTSPAMMLLYRILQLAVDALGDSESYVFLAAIHTIAAIGDASPHEFVPLLAEGVVRGEMTNHVQSSTIPLTEEQRVKLAEALLNVVRRRAAIYEYLPIMLKWMLFGSDKSERRYFMSIEERRTIQQQTHQYIVTGSLDTDPVGGNGEILDTDREEIELRAKAGGPLFSSEEADTVRAAAISILVEAVSLSPPGLLAPYASRLVSCVMGVLTLDSGRPVRRAGGLLARELYSALLREQKDLISDPSGASIAFGKAMILAQDEALGALLDRCASARDLKDLGTKGERCFDPATSSRCQEAIAFREKAEVILSASQLAVAAQRAETSTVRMLHDLSSSGRKHPEKAIPDILRISERTL